MFKLRNIVTVALVLGVAAGIWLGDLWKGLGGSGLGLGKGPSVVATDENAATPAAPPETTDQPLINVGPAETVRVVVRDRSYFLKDGTAETSISLDTLVDSVRNAGGDEDGIRLRVYRAENARVTADVQLREALERAEIPESAVYWSPEPVP